MALFGPSAFQGYTPRKRGGEGGLFLRVFSRRRLFSSPPPHSLLVLRAGFSPFFTVAKKKGEGEGWGDDTVNRSLNLFQLTALQAGCKKRRGEGKKKRRGSVDRMGRGRKRDGVS